MWARGRVLSHYLQHRQLGRTGASVRWTFPQPCCNRLAVQHTSPVAQTAAVTQNSPRLWRQAQALFPLPESTLLLTLQAQQKAAAARLHNIDFYVADADDCAFPPATFDAILCSSTLPFLPDARASLARWHFWLRPGGRAVFNIPKAGHTF
jgi:SAM-dependent methyltransferase